MQVRCVYQLALLCNKLPPKLTGLKQHLFYLVLDSVHWWGWRDG